MAYTRKNNGQAGKHNGHRTDHVAYMRKHNEEESEHNAWAGENKAKPVEDNALVIFLKTRAFSLFRLGLQKDDEIEGCFGCHLPDPFHNCTHPT